MAEEETQVEEQVDVFVVRCPLGEQCSKKHRILSKKLSEEKARIMAAWHLQHSPYHKLSQEEAETLALGMEVETYQESKSWHEQEAGGQNRNTQQQEEAQDSSATPTRTATPTDTPPNEQHLQARQYVLNEQELQRLRRSMAAETPDEQVRSRLQQRVSEGPDLRDRLQGVLWGPEPSIFDRPPP